MEDFCLHCGTIKVVTAKATFTQCGVCNNREHTDKLINSGGIKKMEIRFRGELNFEDDKVNKAKQKQMTRVIERHCRRCERTTDFTYTTMQTRSADEGQTVFYTCTICNETEIEYA